MISILKCLFAQVWLHFVASKHQYLNTLLLQSMRKIQTNVETNYENNFFTFYWRQQVLIKYSDLLLFEIH